MVELDRICPERVAENRVGIARAQAEFEQGDTSAGFATVSEACVSECPGGLKVPLRLFGVTVPFVKDMVCPMVCEPVEIHDEL